MIKKIRYKIKHCQIFYIKDIKMDISLVFININNILATIGFIRKKIILRNFQIILMTKNKTNKKINKKTNKIMIYLQKSLKLIQIIKIIKNY